jgi:imidazole glycerol phosphate synthase glutamine amidotransferase subunit
VTSVAIVPTGTANTASVVAAFQRLGAMVSQAGTAGAVESAPFLIVPGVGSFGAAMSQIEALALREAIRERIDADRPTLAVCVGMQLLSTGSEESPEASGLGVVGAPVRRFAGDIRVPQLGWNQVLSPPESRFVEPGWAYFANSYRIERAPEGWLAATTEYGGRFVSAMERGNVLACQFHPELSGSWGASLLGRWMEQAMVAA